MTRIPEGPKKRLLSAPLDYFWSRNFNPGLSFFTEWLKTTCCVHITGFDGTFYEIKKYISSRELQA